MEKFEELKRWVNVAGANIEAVQTFAKSAEKELKKIDELIKALEEQVKKTKSWKSD